MSSGTSDTDSDGERLRLQEAVQGAVGLVGEDTASKKKSLSKRPSSAMDSHLQQHVPKDVQSFLTKKLAQFLDSQYEISTIPNATQDSTLQHTARGSNQVKLLHTSHHPISLEPPPPTTTTRKRLRYDTPSDYDSEEEEARLLEAVLDPDTLLKQSKPKYSTN